MAAFYHGARAARWNRQGSILQQPPGISPDGGCVWRKWL